MDPISRTFRAFIDALFPKRSDALLLEHLEAHELRTLMNPTKTDEVVSLLPFSDERVRACIHEAKFHANQKAMTLLAFVLRAFLLSNGSRDGQLIIPVPLSHARKCERGYDQVERILHKAAKEHDITIVTDLLERTRDTAPQTSLSRRERLRNVADAFGVRDETRARELLRDQQVILIDDVTTTGATLKAANAALLPLTPASITCVALAH